VRGLAWSPSGDEIWFTATAGTDDKALLAVDMRGRERLLLAGPTDLLLFDVAPDGRMLLGRETALRHVEALLVGTDRPRDFSIRLNSMARSLPADGKSIVVTDQAANGYAVFLRPADGSPPVRLGEGDGYALSPDGRWVVALTRRDQRQIVLHPTGPGESKELPNPESLNLVYLRWLPDGRIVMFGSPTGPGHRRGYVLDPRSGPPRPFTPENVEPVRYWATPVSPDGTRVVARDSEGRVNAYPVDGGAPEPFRTLKRDDLPLEWSADGRALLVASVDGPPWRILHHEIASGRESPVTDVAANQVAGARLSWIFITPDGRYWAHSYSRLLMDVYLAEGVR
jgi:eukaryotic-like serine/threonine-protein kinase